MIAEMVAERIAGQARELFSHLPESEIGEDDPLYFSQDAQGGLIVHVDATGSDYVLFQGHSVRCRRLTANEADVTIWRGGQLVEYLTICLDAMEAILWPTEQND